MNPPVKNKGGTSSNCRDNYCNILKTSNLLSETLIVKESPHRDITLSHDGIDDDDDDDDNNVVEDNYNSAWYSMTLDTKTKNIVKKIKSTPQICKKWDILMDFHKEQRSNNICGIIMQKRLSNAQLQYIHVDIDYVKSKLDQSQLKAAAISKGLDQLNFDLDNNNLEDDLTQLLDAFVRDKLESLGESTARTMPIISFVKKHNDDRCGIHLLIPSIYTCTCVASDINSSLNNFKGVECDKIFTSPWAFPMERSRMKKKPYKNYIIRIGAEGTTLCQAESFYDKSVKFPFSPVYFDRNIIFKVFYISDPESKKQKAIPSLVIVCDTHQCQIELAGGGSASGASSSASGASSRSKPRLSEEDDDLVDLMSNLSTSEFSGCINNAFIKKLQAKAITKENYKYAQAIALTVPPLLQLPVFEAVDKKYYSGYEDWNGIKFTVSKLCASAHCIDNGRQLSESLGDRFLNVSIMKSPSHSRDAKKNADIFKKSVESQLSQTGFNIGDFDRGANYAENVPIFIKFILGHITDYTSDNNHRVKTILVLFLKLYQTITKTDYLAQLGVPFHIRYSSQGSAITPLQQVYKSIDMVTASTFCDLVLKNYEIVRVQNENCLYYYKIPELSQFELKKSVYDCNSTTYVISQIGNAIAQFSERNKPYQDIRFKIIKRESQWLNESDPSANVLEVYLFSQIIQDASRNEIFTNRQFKRFPQRRSKTNSSYYQNLIFLYDPEYKLSTKKDFQVFFDSLPPPNFFNYITFDRDYHRIFLYDSVEDGSGWQKRGATSLAAEKKHYHHRGGSASRYAENTMSNEQNRLICSELTNFDLLCGATCPAGGNTAAGCINDKRASLAAERNNHAYENSCTLFIKKVPYFCHPEFSSEANCWIKSSLSGGFDAVDINNMISTIANALNNISRLSFRVISEFMDEEELRAWQKTMDKSQCTRMIPHLCATPGGPKSNDVIRALPIKVTNSNSMIEPGSSKPIFPFKSFIYDIHSGELKLHSREYMVKRNCGFDMNFYYYKLFYDNYTYLSETTSNNLKPTDGSSSSSSSSMMTTSSLENQSPSSYGWLGRLALAVIKNSISPIVPFIDHDMYAKEFFSILANILLYNPDKRIVLLVGAKDTGKTNFINSIFKACIGEFFVSCDANEFTSKNGPKPFLNAALASEARVVNLGEFDKSAHEKNISIMLKTLSSFGDKISCRTLYDTGGTFSLFCTVIGALNQYPNNDRVDNTHLNWETALVNRLCTITFTNNHTAGLDKIVIPAFHERGVKRRRRGETAEASASAVSSKEANPTPPRMRYDDCFSLVRDFILFAALKTATEISNNGTGPDPPPKRPRKEGIIHPEETSFLMKIYKPVLIDINNEIYRLFSSKLNYFISCFYSHDSGEGVFRFLKSTFDIEGITFIPGISPLPNISYWSLRDNANRIYDCVPGRQKRPHDSKNYPDLTPVDKVGRIRVRQIIEDFLTHHNTTTNYKYIVRGYSPSELSSQENIRYKIHNDTINLNIEDIPEYPSIEEYPKEFLSRVRDGIRKYFSNIHSRYIFECKHNDHAYIYGIQVDEAFRKKTHGQGKN